MFEWLFDFSIFGLLRLLIFVAVGTLIGVLIRHYLWRAKNQILYCRERDGRGLELDIKEEDALSLTTNTNPIMRFYKWGRSYEFQKRGRSLRKFFAKEGTALTWKLFGFLGTKKKPKRIELKFPTLEAAVIHTWGKEKYNDVPEDLQRKLQDNEVLVTVDLEPGITPEGYEPISESTIEDKGDEDAAALWAQSLSGVTKQPWIQYLAVGGLGSAVTYTGLMLLGVIG